MPSEVVMVCANCGEKLPTDMTFSQKPGWRQPFHEVLHEGKVSLCGPLQQTYIHDDNTPKLYDRGA